MTTQEQMDHQSRLIYDAMLQRFGQMDREERARWAAGVAGVPREGVLDAELRRDGRELVLELVRPIEFISFTVSLKP